MNEICVYTVHEVAEILRISCKTVYKLLKEGELKSVKVRGQIRITSEQLRDYLKGDEIHERRT